MDTQHPHRPAGRQNGDNTASLLWEHFVLIGPETCPDILKTRRCTLGPERSKPDADFAADNRDAFSVAQRQVNAVVLLESELPKLGLLVDSTEHGPFPIGPVEPNVWAERHGPLLNLLDLFDVDSLRYRARPGPS